MADLNIQNVNKIVQGGNIENLYGTSAAPMEGLTKDGQSNSIGSFSDILKDSVEKTNLYQTQADTAIKELVAGRSKNIHETMLTIERADTSLKLMMQVRNKILDAYREIMRMQV